MPPVVREEGSAPIPEDLAKEFGIHKGSSVEWERTEDGRLTLRPSLSRQAAAQKLRGMGKAGLKPGEKGVELFLAELQKEREMDPTY